MDKLKTKLKNREKERALGAYSKQYKQRCSKCGKYGHKSDICKCSSNKKEQQKWWKKEKNHYKKYLDYFYYQYSTKSRHVEIVFFIFL